MSELPLLVWQNEASVRLSTIFDWVVNETEVDTLLVIERSSEDMAGRHAFSESIARNVESIFGKNLVERFTARGWPGTELIGHKARVHVVRFDEAVRKKMISTENKLFNWTHQPNKLPEDICLFRKGSKHVTFASITHEKDAFVVTHKELLLNGFVRTKYSVKEMLLGWDGPYFCLL